MNAGLQCDVSKAVRVFDRYQLATKKSGAEILNKFIKDVAFRSAQFTPKASAAKIRSGLFKDPHLRYALTSLALKRKGIGRSKSPEFQKAVDTFVARRLSSSAYLRSAFAEAIQRLSGTYNEAKFAGSSGFANKATIGRLIAEMGAIVSQPTASKARSAEKILNTAMRKAINDKLQDMLDYANKLLAQNAREVTR